MIEYQSSLALYDGELLLDVARRIASTLRAMQAL